MWNIVLFLRSSFMILIAIQTLNGLHLKMLNIFSFLRFKNKSKIEVFFQFFHTLYTPHFSSSYLFHYSPHIFIIIVFTKKASVVTPWANMYEIIASESSYYTLEIFLQFTFTLVCGIYATQIIYWLIRLDNLSHSSQGPGERYTTSVNEDNSTWEISQKAHTANLALNKVNKRKV